MNHDRPQGLQLTTPTDTTIVFTRRFNAPRQVVREAMFTEVVPHERAVHTETTALGSGEAVGSLVETHEFAERSGVTTVSITQAYPSKDARDGAVASGMDREMETCFARLDALLAQRHLPDGYVIRPMRDGDHAEVSAICAQVYPTERPYTEDELRAHQALFPEGQFVVEHEASRAVAGAHFTLLVNMMHFHVDDSWDALTAGGTFADHDPQGHTLYGADLFVHPGHQHHGLGRALTDATRGLVQSMGLWRMVGGSRMPGYGRVAGTIAPDDYIARVKRAEVVDPVLTAHLHDGWDAITAIRGYLPHDEESAGWAAVIQWLNPECPPPPAFDLSRVPRKA